MSPRPGTRARPAAAIALMMAGLVSATAQSAYRLLVLPVAHGPEVSAERAKLVEDMIVSALLETGAFDLSVRAGELGAAEDDAQALERARAAGAGFALQTRLGAEGRPGAAQTFTVVWKLTAVDTGKDLFARTSKFDEARLASVIGDDARRIAVAAKARSDVTVALVDAFIKAKDWEAASRYLELYLSLHPADAAKLAPQSAAVAGGLASFRYGEAHRLASLGLYDEARRSAAEAAALMPGASEYRSYADELEEEYVRYLAQTDGEKLDAAEAFFLSDKLDIAATLVARAGERARASARGRALEASISRAIEARGEALRAAGFLKVRKYAEALAAIDAALALRPDHGPHIKLRARIMAEETRDAATRERLEAYREEFRAFDWAALFASRKPVPTGWTVAAGSLDVGMYDPATGAWDPVLRGHFPELEARFNGSIPDRVPDPFSFTDLAFSWFALGGGSTGVEREQALAPGPLMTGTTFEARLGAGAGVRLEALSFALRLELRSDLSWMRYREKYLDLAGATVSESLSDTWTWGAGLGADLAWSPARGVAVFAGLARIWPLVSSVPLESGAPTRTVLRFGLELEGSRP